MPRSLPLSQTIRRAYAQWSEPSEHPIRVCCYQAALKGAWKAVSFLGPALKNQTSLLKCPKRLTTIPAGSKPEPMGWSGRGLVPQACLAPMQMRSDAECSAWSHQRLCWTWQRPGIPAPRSLSALFCIAGFCPGRDLQLCFADEVTQELI